MLTPAVALLNSAPAPSPLTLLLAMGLAAIHLLARNIEFLNVAPRSRWLSFAGGASLAYVFIHIFPELNSQQMAIARINNSAIGVLEHHVYLVALFGFTVFYGLEKFAATSRQNSPTPTAISSTSTRVFWIHILSFALYNALIGYLLLHREEPSLRSLLLFFVAMALHFIVNDYGLRDHHKAPYDRHGRWILAGTVLVGWAIGQATEIDAAALAVLFAFLAGGIILNVIKEELPEERESRFSSFVLGAGMYTFLLLLI